jgi:hypothetical protein
MDNQGKTSIYAIKKLTVAADYEEWSFSMKMLLFRDKLYGYAENTVDPVEYDEEQDKVALSTICLGLDPSLYVHVNTATTAAEAWKKLQEVFKPKGTVGRISILSQLINTKLTDCKDVPDYVNRMTLASQQLKLADFTMEELVGSLMLIGLTEDYRTLTMVLDHSDKPITQDLVKNRLMAEYNRRQLERDCKRQNCVGRQQ